MIYTKIEHSKNNIEFKLNNLPVGISHTVVHPIKRFLTMRTPNFACVALCINNIAHEFSSTEGILEGAFDLINNISSIRFAVNEKTIEKNTFVVTLSTKKIGEVNAADFVSEVDIINSDLKICEKTNDNLLEIKLLIALDIGYRTKEENMNNFAFDEDVISENEKVIFIDSNHSAIKTFSFSIKEIVGNDAREELTIRIETEEGTSPEEAFKYAVYSCVNVFDALVNDKNSFFEKVLISRTRTRSTRQVEFVPIEELEISNRSYNCLKNKGIKNLNELASLTKEDIRNTKNFGNVSMQEISAVMQKYGIKFKDED